MPGETISEKTRKLRRVLLLLGPAIALIVGGYIYLTGGRYVGTQNAYVKADLVAMSAEISGPIFELGADDNDPVTDGQMLFRIDPRPYEIAHARARARLSAARDEIEGLKSLYRQKSEELSMAQTDLEFAEREHGRQAALEQNGFASRARLDEARTDVETAHQKMGVLTEERAQILSRLSGNPEIGIDDHPSYLEAMAESDDALLDLERTSVRAPFAGVVVKAPELGQYVNAGTPVMNLVGSQNVWIEANFKETDLANVEPGQPVDIRVDTYGSRTWRGEVESIAYATGAESSILPPQNASGNWVKIVQRIPVRIRVIEEEGSPRLRAGMSTRVTIDTEPAESGSAQAPGSAQANETGATP